MVDMTPDVGMLLGLRAQRFDPALLLGEAIDNSLDAGARSVTINMEHDKIQISDDGCGIDRAHFNAVVILGRHGELVTTRLGQYGLGFKMQAFNAGDQLNFNSVSKDGRVSFQIDWEVMSRTGWKTSNEPRWLPVSIKSSTGTTFVISNLRQKKKMALDRLERDIADRFWPALLDDCRITLNGKKLVCSPEPAMSDIVDRTVPLSGGRGFHVRAGILIEPENARRYAVHVAFNHRAIMMRSSLGCGDGASSRIYAGVSVYGPWELTKFKDEFLNEDQYDELELALSEILGPMLDKIKNESMTANLQALEIEINASIPAVLQRKRRIGGIGGIGGASGSKVSRKGQHDKDRQKHDGEPRSRATLQIDFQGVARDDGIGRFEKGRPHFVHLSPEDPEIRYWIEHKDQEARRRALFAHAFSLFTAGVPGDQIDFDGQDHGLRVAQLFRLQQNDFAEVV